MFKLVLCLTWRQLLSIAQAEFVFAWGCRRNCEFHCTSVECLSWKSKVAIGSASFSVCARSTKFRCPPGRHLVSSDDLALVSALNEACLETSPSLSLCSHVGFVRSFFLHFEGVQVCDHAEEHSLCLLAALEISQERQTEKKQKGVKRGWGREPEVDP